MFIGHYGVSFALKGIDKSIPLWLLFLAVQFVDVLWGILVLLGIEKVRIVPGITATNPLDLYYMPYTHSLIGAFVWSFVLFAVYRFAAASPISASILVGLAVFSHWILDLVVHRPDLPLYDDTAKVGLGLWDFPVAAFGLEIVLLFGGMTIYLRSTESHSSIGKYGPAVLGIVLIALQAMVFFGSPPDSASTAAATALLAYFLFAGLAFWLERYRT